MAYSPPAKILVTGGPGLLGSRFVPQLVRDGLDVTSVSMEKWPSAPCPHYECDLRDLGQAVEALQGFDAVLHLAAIHAEFRWPPAETFHVNVATTFNVFRAATLVGVPRVVSASSAHAGGGRWSSAHTPELVPIRETDFHETGDTYGLSKVVGELLTRHTRAWPGVSFATLRYGYVYSPDEYEQVRARWDDPEYWAHSLWNYVDSRDAYEITRLALVSPFTGSHVLNVTAADQSMNTPTRELVETWLPGTRVSPDVAEFGTLLSIDAAKELLGWEPRHSWREALTGGVSG